MPANPSRPAFSSAAANPERVPWARRYFAPLAIGVVAVLVLCFGAYLVFATGKRSEKPEMVQEKAAGMPDRDNPVVGMPGWRPVPAGPADAPATRPSSVAVPRAAGQ